MPKKKQVNSWTRAKARYFSRGRSGEPASEPGRPPAGSSAGPAVFTHPSNRHLNKEALAFGCIGFLLGRTVIVGALSPFGPAYFLAVWLSSPALAVAAGLGVVAGAYSAGSWFRGVETLLVLALLYRALPRLRLVQARQIAGAAILLFFISLSLKAGLAVCFEPTAYRYLLSFFDSLLQLIFAPIFLQVLPYLTGKPWGKERNPGEAICTLLLVGALLLGVTQLRVGGFSLANIFGCFAILVFALLGGAGVGAGLGVVFSVAANLSLGLVPASIGLNAFNGFLAGTFRSFGKFGVGLGLVVANLLLSFFLRDSALPLITPAETLTAWALLAIVPLRQLEYARHFLPGMAFTPPEAAVSETRRQDQMAARLGEFARVFHELSGAFNQVAASKEFPGGSNLPAILRTVVERVCDSCGSYKPCWEKDFYAASQQVLELVRVADAEGRVAPEQVGEDLLRRCHRCKEMVGTINHLAEEARLDRYWRRKVDETREVVAGQLEGVAQIVSTLASELKLDFGSREELADAVAIELDALGCGNHEAVVQVLERNRVEIMISRPACAGSRLCEARIAQVVSRLAGQTLAVQKIRCRENTRRARCSFKLVTPRLFQVETGFCQAPKDGGNVSGDTHLIRNSRDGKFCMILSDGMGSGARAAMESSATVSLLEQLLAAGFERSLSVRTVNSILVLRSPEETFATVDMATIDLQSAATEFVKIGAAASFVKRGKEVQVIKSASLPIGILNNIEIEVILKSLRPGDILVLVTDGVTDAAPDHLAREEWLPEFLKRTEITSPQDLAEAILRQARALGKGQLRDDMTVVVGRLTLAG